MAENSKIEWTDHTFNPWIGCTRVSAGCDNCYAAVSTPARSMHIAWGPGEQRHRTADNTWAMPKRWNERHQAFYAKHGRRQRVFCASLADVFDNQVPVEWRRDLFDLIELTPNLDWLLLTKRIGNVADMVREARTWDWLLGRGNVWIGATIVNQEEADRDIPKLLATPARVRFLSMEPLLSEVDITPFLWGKHERVDTICQNCPRDADCSCGYETRAQLHLPALHWVIVGGESGHGARPMHPDWARSLRDQCAAAGVPFLFKQVGEAVPVETDVDTDHGHTVYPLDDSIVLPGERYELHTAPSGQYFVRVPKKAAGRQLDGVTHDGFPEVPHA
jgi:protein gp37